MSFLKYLSPGCLLWRHGWYSRRDGAIDTSLLELSGGTFPLPCRRWFQVRSQNFDEPGVAIAGYVRCASRAVRVLFGTMCQHFHQMAFQTKCWPDSASGGIDRQLSDTLHNGVVDRGCAANPRSAAHRLPELLDPGQQAARQVNRPHHRELKDECRRLCGHKRIASRLLLQSGNANVRPGHPLGKLILSGTEKIQHDDLRVLQPHSRPSRCVRLFEFLNPKR